MLLEVNSLTPLGLAYEVGVSAGVISAVLAGRWYFTPDEDARLCARFKLAPGFFLPEEP
jgi:antitoxin component HigA of HigAB toxin-antitoxin module